MNPVIVIPSYWTTTDTPASLGSMVGYDHATPIDKPMPELETCLASLEKVRGVLRVVVLLVADTQCEAGARARVDGICRTHPNLAPMVIGSTEAAVIEQAASRMSPGMPVSSVSLHGYGPIRNMGLAVASALGHDVVVFLDDDEVVLDEDFLIDATYGLGLSNRQGLPIVAKSGYYLDRQDSPYADVNPPAWRDRPWSKRGEFNALMQQLLTGTRISRSTYVCGGCFAIAASAFCKVGFDPVIPRGEDLDYLFNLRMNGIDLWFDNQWRVKHLPPESPSYAARFLQDVYRWEYERQKLATVNATIGLRHVTSESLEPYPGSWVSDKAADRALRTARRRALVGPERSAYLWMISHGFHAAQAWAIDHASSYLSFQTYWPRMMELMWNNDLIARRILATATPDAMPHPIPSWVAGVPDPSDEELLPDAVPSLPEPSDAEELHE